jgi:hypothetical protein
MWRIIMFDEYNPLSRIPDNSKAGITVCLNRKEGGEPFEATVYFKKSGKSPEELRGKDAINITASGKLRLDIGENGFVEIFAEQTGRLKEAESGDAGTGGGEEMDAVPVL